MRITSSGVQINSSGNWSRAIFVNATTLNACGYHMRFGGQDNFFVHASGWIFSQGQYIGSDKKFKKDIKKIPNSLNKVINLRGVNYKLNHSDSMSVFNSNELYMGVVAQEVEKVVPEVVQILPNGTKAVAYQNLVALLIEAIKEQQIQIESLQNDVSICCESKNTTKSSTVSAITNANDIDPTKNLLYQNTPNPFSENTKIKYFIANESKNSMLCMFDMQGNPFKVLCWSN